MVLRGEVHYALKGVMLTGGVAGLGQSIGVNQQAVRIVEREAMSREIRAGKQTEWNFGSAFDPYASAGYVQKRRVACADKLDGAVSRYASSNECCKLARGRALGENAIGNLDHAVERQVG